MILLAHISRPLARLLSSGSHTLYSFDPSPYTLNPTPCTQIQTPSHNILTLNSKPKPETGTVQNVSLEQLVSNVIHDQRPKIPDHMPSGYAAIIRWDVQTSPTA